MAKEMRFDDFDFDCNDLMSSHKCERWTRQATAEYRLEGQTP